MVYNSSTDALQQLLFLESHGGRITKSLETVSMLANGLPYYFVEVTCTDGSQYGIHAYGEEARELREEAMRTAGRIIVTIGERG